MGKSILIIDTPEDCSGCPLFVEHFVMICRANGRTINYPYPQDFKQEWCPLKLIPHKRAVENRWFSKDWAIGFNTCVDELTKENCKVSKEASETESNRVNEMREVKTGRIYKHFKGKNYLVIDIAIHSETREKYVVYKALYGECKTYIRPYDMFASKVDKNKYPDVKQEYRFELLELD